jgi:hypothetical protein
MKKLSLIFGLALGMLTVGCSVDPIVENNTPELGNTVTLGVSLDEQSRTSLGGLVGDKYQVLWAAGDKIAVNGTASEAVAEQYVGQSAAEFTIANVTAPYSVIYPAEAIDKNGQLNLPTFQTYAAGSFASGAAVMAGYATENNVAMKHLLSIVKLTIAQGSEATAAFNAISVTALDGRAISGVFDVDYQAAQIAPAAGKDIVTITNVPIADGKAVVYVAIPAGEYTKGLEVEVVGSDFSTMTRTAYTATGITLGGGYLVNMPELTFAGKATEDIVITTAEQLQTLRETTLAVDNTFKGNIKLGCDIDMTGIITDGVQAYLYEGATFDGQGFAIKNWTAYEGLIYENYGTIKNVVLDKSCSFSIDLSSTAVLACGYIAMANLGTVSGCTNNADITFEDTTLIIQKNRFIGAIVGAMGQRLTGGTTIGDPDSDADKTTYKNARVENCVNNGKIQLTFGGYQNGWWYLGGVVGSYLPHAEISDGGIFNCVNNGDISLYVGANEKVTIVGGVIGSAGKLYNSANANKVAYYCTVENCVNNGKVSYCCLSQGQQLYYGGVAGATHAKVISCKNNGSVTFLAETEQVKPTLYMAGIAGVSSGDFTDCHNAGTVGIDNIDFGYWVAMAGITGRSFNYNPITIADCTNSGKIQVDFTASGNQVHNVAGLVAIAADGNISIVNCHNTGEITMTTPGTGACGAQIGGIAAKITKPGTVENCTNTAAITFNTSAAAGKNSYLGGIVADVETSVVDVTNCVNTGAVTFNNTGTAEVYAGVGGVVGNYYKGGCTMTDCVNKGAVSLLGALKAESCIGGLAATNINSFVGCKSLGSITLNNTGSSTAIIGAIGGRLNNTTCTWNGLEINCAVNYNEGNNIFGLLQGDTWLTTASATVGAVTPCVVKATTTVNGEAVTAAQLAERSFLVGRDQKVVDGTLTESSFVIAEGGLILE